MSKKCIKCEEVKELTDFYKHINTKDKRQSSCIICHKAYYKIHAKVNSEIARVRTREWYRNNTEKSKATSKAWRQTNPEKDAANTKAWRKANPAKMTAKRAKRRAAKLLRTVSWANIKAIKDIYAEARRLEKATGIVMHVDHILPLQGKLVSGLHVETNLQILTWHDNICKSNNFKP